MSEELLADIKKELPTELPKFVVLPFDIFSLLIESLSRTETNNVTIEPLFVLEGSSVRLQVFTGTSHKIIKDVLRIFKESNGYEDENQPYEAPDKKGLEGYG